MKEPIDLEFPEELAFILNTPMRYKVLYGGRAGVKSHSFARGSIIKALESKKRILCTRNYQNSIADSVHKLLENLIYKYKLDKWFKVTDKSITNYLGSEFIFKGLERSIDEIRSLEDIDICWIEEAASVTKKSWEILIPTIRAKDSEIWIGFNPDEKRDFTYQNFVINPRARSIVKKTYYFENPFLQETSRLDAEECKLKDPDSYRNIWLGYPKTRNDAQIFKGKWEKKEFKTPELHEMEYNRFFFGADWGFSLNPTALIRFFIQNRCLFIEYEAFGVGVDLNDLSKLFCSIPEARKWPIKADNSRPETISYMAQEYDPERDEKGFNVTGAKKWPGCVEDGIEYIKSFDMIYIHPRCVNMLDEAHYYSYKQDKTTEEILPIIIKEHDHGWDAIRYGLDGYISNEADPEYDEADNNLNIDEKMTW